MCLLQLFTFKTNMTPFLNICTYGLYGEGVFWQTNYVLKYLVLFWNR